VILWRLKKGKESIDILCNMANNDDVFDEPDSFYSDMSKLYQAGAIIGTIGAFAVLLTGCMFWREMVRNKIYMKLLMAMSLCDFFGTIVGTYGFYEIPEWACRMQAVCWFLFNRASWMYTAWMAVTLFTHVSFGKVYVQFRSITAITVIISVVMMVLPLLFSPFEYGMCQFQDGTLSLPKNIPWTTALVLAFHAWLNGMYFVPLIITACIPLSLVLYTRIFVYSRMKLLNTAAASRGSLAMRCIQNVQYYPVLMTLFWLPNYIVILTQPNALTAGRAQLQALMHRGLATLILSTFYPLGIAIYFFFRSSEARMRWRKALGVRSAADTSMFGNTETDAEADDDSSYRSSANESSSGADVFNPAVGSGGALAIEAATHTQTQTQPRITRGRKSLEERKLTRTSHGEYEIDFDDDAEIQRLSEAMLYYRESSVGRDSRLPGDRDPSSTTGVELPNHGSSA